jgi:hypothetical protein
MVQSAEQNPAQRQQSQRLPEAKRAPAEQRRKKPVPQVHHHFTANKGKQHHPYYRQRRHPKPSPFRFHIRSLIS